MKKINSINELVGMSGYSKQVTPKNKKGLIYINTGYWEFKCNEDVNENDKLQVVSVIDNLVLFVKKVM